jgi:predicted nucleotidyltransferase component of viral defense system
MEQNQLDNLTATLGISKDQILREEAEMSILDALAKDKLAAQMIFYGGTALRLAYNSPRFSEDLDFIAVQKIDFTDFKNFLNVICASHDRWSIHDLKNKRNTMFALILIKDDKLKHNFTVKIEIRQTNEKIKLETSLSIIKSQTSIAEPLLLVPTLSALRQLKINALRERKKARDIFDLWYIAQTARENFVLPKNLPGYSEREFKNELQVFLPKKYYPVIKQLYEQTNTKA